jgi:hypothetical protein
MIPQIPKKGPGGVIIRSYLFETLPVFGPYIPDTTSIIGTVAIAASLIYREYYPSMPVP